MDRNMDKYKNKALFCYIYTQALFLLLLQIYIYSHSSGLPLVYCKAIGFMIFIFSIIMIYSVLSVSTVQQCDPVLHTYIFFFSHYPPSGSVTVARYCSLCSTAGSHCLSTPN